MESLAVKYRPKTFEEICGQSSTIKILEKQLATGKFTNCYLFAGNSGCGKTTLARAFANALNNNLGSPIEIDGASNNGVDAVRDIVDAANERAIDAEYKVFIIDECHAVTTQGWQAFLKCIEEPPRYTIFIFCTTNPEKIPETVLSRIMRFNISKVDTALVAARLKYICAVEGYTNYEEACNYIAKLGGGSVRDSIAYLEKCTYYDTDLSINNVVKCLGNFSYDTMFDFTGALLNNDEASVLQTVENYYNSGNDLKLFVENYLDFCLDLAKYCLFKNMSSVKIPSLLEHRCIGYSNIPNALSYANDLVEKVLEIKNMLKYDTNILTTVEAMFIGICRNSEA